MPLKTGAQGGPGEEPKSSGVRGRSPSLREAAEPGCLSRQCLNMVLVGYALFADDSCISLLFLAYWNKPTAFSFCTFLLLETIS